MSIREQLNKYRAEWDLKSSSETMQEVFLGTQLQDALSKLESIRSVDQINMLGSFNQVGLAIAYSCSGNAQGKWAEKLGAAIGSRSGAGFLRRREIGEPFSSLGRSKVGNEISALNYYDCS